MSASRPATSRCIVVFGTKGGVGKTAVAVNLAVSLAPITPRNVCVVDLDVMASGDVAKMLGLNPQQAVANLAAQLKRSPLPTELPIKDLLVSHVSGVHLIQCVTNLRQANALSPALLQGLFRTLKSQYEYIIVDAGKGFTDPLMTAFDEANLILLVATPDIISLYQTKWAMNLIESLLFPANIVKGVLNRAESRGGVSSEDVRSAIPCELVGALPSDGRAMGMAINQGTPVVLLYGRSKLAEAFRRMAETLMTRSDLYLSHQDIPRHRKPLPEGAQAPPRLTTGLSRIYAHSDDGQVSGEEDDEIARLKRHIHEKLVEELNLKKVDLSLLNNPEHMQEMRRRCEQVIANLLSREIGGIISSHEVRTCLVNEILDEALGLGPLEELIADPTISDILVNNKDQIYIERKGKLELTAKKFISNDQVRAIIERIVTPLGRRIDESVPMVDARLPDGSRVNAIIPPLSVKGPALSIRKFVGIRYTKEDLIRLGTLNDPMAQFIKACVVGRKNLIVSGGTGSGKTTLLNIVSSFIPEQERILTIEDAAELRLMQTHWVCLEARPSNIEGKGQITIRDLFRNALRMRPDRIVIGECRGAETLDMLQAMNTGHDGSLTTVHANSPKDVVSRLDSMVLMSSIEMPVRAIREMVASAIHLIVHTNRCSDGSRKIISISELVGLTEGIDVVFRDLFMFQQTGVAPDGTVLGQFVATGQLPTFFDELRVKGIPMDASLFRQKTADPVLPSP